MAEGGGGDKKRRRRIEGRQVTSSDNTGHHAQGSSGGGGGVKSGSLQQHVIATQPPSQPMIQRECHGQVATFYPRMKAGQPGHMRYAVLPVGESATLAVTTSGFIVIGQFAGVFNGAHELLYKAAGLTIDQATMGGTVRCTHLHNGAPVYELGLVSGVLNSRHWNERNLNRASEVDANSSGLVPKAAESRDAYLARATVELRETVEKGKMFWCDDFRSGACVHTLPPVPPRPRIWFRLLRRLCE